MLQDLESLGPVHVAEETVVICCFASVGEHIFAVELGPVCLLVQDNPDVDDVGNEGSRTALPGEINDPVHFQGGHLDLPSFSVVCRISLFGRVQAQVSAWIAFQSTRLSGRVLQGGSSNSEFVSVPVLFFDSQESSSASYSFVLWPARSPSSPHCPCVVVTLAAFVQGDSRVVAPSLETSSVHSKIK